MIKLVCALVGMAGSAFPVTIDESELVGDLKQAIKKEKENDLKAVDARKLRLFLGRNGDNTWLESSSEDVKKLKKGEKTAFIKALTHEDNELQGASGLEKVLKDMPEPSTDQIHVLVVVPRHKGLGAPAMPLDKRTKQEVEVGVRQLDQLVTMAAQLRGGKAEGLLVTPMYAFETWMPAGMYIRQEYLTLRDIIMEQLKANRRVLVLGSPGIGKSVFGVFMLLQFMIEEKDVAYRPLGEQMTYYFTWNGTNYEFSETPRAGKSYAGFFDGSEASGALVLHCFDHVFLFASPRTRNYSHFVKDTCFKVYMNPWTKDECQRYVDAVKKATPAVDVDDWFLRFNLVGGKPRYLFSSDSFEYLEAEVEKAIPFDHETLKMRVRRLEKGIFDDQAMHMMLSLYRSDRNPSLAYVAYSSLVVEAILSARYNVESADEFHTWLHTPALDLQSWRGRELEKFLLQALATKTLCIRALEGDYLAETHIGPFHAKSEKIHATSAIKSELMFYLPLSKTFPAIDGVLVLPADRTIIYAQATVATLHPVKYQQLKDVYQDLAQRQEFHGYTHAFLFIVSSDIYDNFAYQPYKNVNGEDCRQEVDIAVTQYVGKTVEKKTSAAKTAATDTGSGKRTTSSESGPRLSPEHKRRGQKATQK